MGKSKKHKKFFQEDSPHGVVKRVMYKKYLQAYIAKTQNDKFTLRSKIIDGFAGAGRYSNEWPEEIEKYGSPLITMMVVLEHRWKCQRDKEKKEKKAGAQREDTSTGKVFGWEPVEMPPREELDKMEKNQRGGPCAVIDPKVSMMFIEKDKDNYTTLLCNIELLIMKFLKRNFPDIQYNVTEDENKARFSITTSPFSVSIEVLNQPFEEYEPSRDDLLADDVRSLTFVDPFGYTHTPMDHLKKFAPGEGNEIVINFMSRDVNRFAKVNPEAVRQLYGIDTPDIEEDKDLANFIQYVIHEPNSDDEGARGEERGSIQKCVDSYERFLKRKTDSSYSLVFEVRGENNCIIYHMVHITNHIRGVEAMKTSMIKCSQQEGEMVMSDYDIIRKGMKLNFQKQQDDDVVANIIFEHFKGKQDILVQPTASETNARGQIARRNGKSSSKISPSVKEFVLLETKYCLWKKPLAILQRERKIIEVLENNQPQKRKNTFPEIDNVTKLPIETRICFAPESSEAKGDEHMQVDTTLDAKDKKGQNKGKRRRPSGETTHAKEVSDRKRRKKQTDRESPTPRTSCTH